VRTWLIGCSLLALVTGFAPPVWAESLNALFTFPTITFTRTVTEEGGLLFDRRVWHGTGGQFVGMGNLTLDLTFMPDPEGGHPLGRSLVISGLIPELEITDDTGPVFAGVILEAFDIPGGFLFDVAWDGSHPALGLGDGVYTWVALVPVAQVPGAAAGLLVGAGVLLTARRWLRRS
jgi:hypothetical protein